MDELMTGLSVKQVGNSEKLHWIERRSRPLKEKTRSYSVTCLCARRVYSFSLRSFWIVSKCSPCGGDASCPDLYVNNNSKIRLHCIKCWLASRAFTKGREKTDLSEVLLLCCSRVPFLKLNLQA